MSDPFDTSRLAQYRARARLLGEMAADGRITDDDAQLTLQFVIEAAAKAAPEADRRGLQTRLVWDMRHHAEGMWLARQRVERQQERDLASIAEAGITRGDDVWTVKKAMAAKAKTMQPVPTIETLDAALKVGQWRAKWTKT